MTGPLLRRGPGRWARRALLPLALGTAAGCGSDPTGAEPVADVTIEPAAPVVALAETIRLTATPRDAGGDPLPDRSVVWASADPEIASIDASGNVVPQATGRVQIAASSEGQSTVVELQVLPRRVRAVEVTASATAAEVGDTVTVQVLATGVDGAPIDDRPIVFSSSAPSVATVDEEGRVVARGAGTTEIAASVEGIAATVALTVAPPRPATVELSPADAELDVGSTLRLAATVRDRLGGQMPDAPVTYATSAPGVATVAADGTVRGVSAGDVTITATAGDASGTARIRVTPLPPARLTVAPATAMLTAGETVTVTTTLRDAEDNVIHGRPVAWTSTDNGVARVSSGGVITAVSPGTATVRASSAGLVAEVRVTVNARPVGRVNVTPGSFALQSGATRQLVVEVADAAGVPLAGRSVSWSSTATAVATVTPAGQVRAVGPGTATIRATSEGVVGTATVTVTAPPPPPPEPEPGRPARMEIVSGDDQEGKRGEELPQPLVVRVVDADGRPVPGVFVLWLTTHGGSTTPMLATTDENGRASVRWRLGMAPQRQTATASSLFVTSVSFTADARK